MKTSSYFLILLYLSLIVSCQEKEPEPEAKLPPTGCDGDLTGTNCQQFFIPAGEILSYPSGTEIKASEGIEINGDIVVDPAAGGDFTLTATSGDIVISGKILVKDTTDDNSSGGRYKNGKSTSRLKNGKAADGFTLTLDASGANGNIILRKGATLFSGRGQHALDEVLTTITDYHEGEAGGNGGLIILNAPNGKVILPDLSNPVTPYQDELFVLGNGGNGANVDIDDNLETANPEVMEVRGGLGGNSGHLIIDALEIEGIPALEAMQTHPDFIYGGEGGQGGYVIWENAGKDKKYTLLEIILHGGDAGDGAKVGGNGGFTFFTVPAETFVEVGNPIPGVFCYGGDGGDVFASPLPHQAVYGGDGGAYAAHGVSGWDGGEDKEGNLIRDGSDGGSALGQGGNGGNILTGVSAYQAVGGSGGNSDKDREYIFNHFGFTEGSFLFSTFRVVAGRGGAGYSDCEGCRGGNGGNAGTATAKGGKGGDVMGEAMQGTGGEGGDTWALVRGVPGDGGDGNPAGAAGDQPPGSFLNDTPGKEGASSTPGALGESLGFDLNGNLAIAYDGETCGEDLECEDEEDPNNDPPLEGSCWERGERSFTYKYTAIKNFASGTRTTVRTIQGTYVEEGSTCGSCWECTREYVETTTYSNGSDPKINSHTTTAPCSASGVSPFCTPTGDLFYPGGTSEVSYSDPTFGEVSVSFNGCYYDDTAPAICCKRNENDSYYFWGGETCPE